MDIIGNLTERHLLHPFSGTGIFAGIAGAGNHIAGWLCMMLLMVGLAACPAQAAWKQRAGTGPETKQLTAWQLKNEDMKRGRVFTLPLDAVMMFS